MAIAPAVPDVSLLEESSPKLAPRPERPALQQLTDNRLNRSPLVKEKTLSSAYHHDQAARKVGLKPCVNSQLELDVGCNVFIGMEAILFPRRPLSKRLLYGNPS